MYAIIVSLHWALRRSHCEHFNSQAWVSKRILPVDTCVTPPAWHHPNSTSTTSAFRLSLLEDSAWPALRKEKTDTVEPQLCGIGVKVEWVDWLEALVIRHIRYIRSSSVNNSCENLFNYRKKLLVNLFIEDQTDLDVSSVPAQRLLESVVLWQTRRLSEPSLALKNKQ